MSLSRWTSYALAAADAAVGRVVDALVDAELRGGVGIADLVIDG